MDTRLGAEASRGHADVGSEARHGVDDVTCLASPCQSLGHADTPGSSTSQREALKPDFPLLVADVDEPASPASRASTVSRADSCVKVEFASSSDAVVSASPAAADNADDAVSAMATEADLDAASAAAVSMAGTSSIGQRAVAEDDEQLAGVNGDADDLWATPPNLAAERSVLHGPGSDDDDDVDDVDDDRTLPAKVDFQVAYHDDNLVDDHAGPLLPEVDRMSVGRVSCASNCVSVSGTSAASHTAAPSSSRTPSIAGSAGSIGRRSNTPSDRAASVGHRRHAPIPSRGHHGAIGAMSTVHLSSPMPLSHRPSTAPAGSVGSAGATGAPTAVVSYRTAASAKMINQYILGEVLGEGAYGKVREALDSITLRRVAIKKIKRLRLKRMANAEAAIRREVDVMKRLKRHRNVVELIEVIVPRTDKDAMYIVLEHVNGGSLQSLLEQAQGNKLPLLQARSYLAQLMDGLESLHNQGIVHRDIKPGNLMISRDGTLKISDFGVAERLELYKRSDVLSKSSGSPAFQPPEIASGREEFFGFKVDIWSSGVTLFLMVTGKYPFSGQNVYKLFENISSGRYVIPDYIDDALASLIRGMLDPNDTTRFTIDQVRKHPWMQMMLNTSEPFVQPLPRELGRPNTGPSSVLPYIATMYSTDFPRRPGRLSMSSTRTSSTTTTTTSAARREPSKPTGCLPRKRISCVVS